MKKKIAIIGAGIGGLTLANLLQKDSEFEFIIYEKEETLNLKEGFGIQLAVNSVFILNRIGFSSLSKVEMYNPLELDFYSNKDKICNLDLSQFNSETEKYTTLKRSILIKFLKEKLFTNSIRFNKTVERVRQNQNTIKIDFKDGESEEVDYLVVSDGVYSQTKSIIENKVFSPNYLGSLAIRTTVQTRKILDFNKMNISLLMSSKAHMVLYPVNTAEHNLVFIVRNKVLNFSDERKLDFIETILEKSILKKNNNLKSLLTGVLNYWPIYTSKDAINSKFKNVFYLGDAFYTLPPTMAQGASQSVEGAMELFQSFKDQNSNKKNLYFTNRLNRIKITKKRSSLNYFAFHFSNKLLVIFRNLLFKKMIKNKKFIENYLGKVFRK